MANKKTRIRPKGYAPWKPQRKTEIILDQVDQVLADYADQLPLTVRQIFYRLVGAYGYEKTENAYERLGNCLTRARRSGRLPFEVIRDDSASVLNHIDHFDGEEGFYQYMHRLARRFKQNKLANQRVAIRLHCEAEGMMPQLHNALEPYSVPVYSCSGFDSLTARYQLAEWCHDTFVYRGKYPVVLHLGDYDPDGESIFEVLRDDVVAFLRRDAPRLAALHAGASSSLFNRVALTGWQVQHHRLPTAPPKKSSSRTAAWKGTATCQLEALPPDVLQRIVVLTVQDYLDQDILQRDRETEVTARPP